MIMTAKLRVRLHVVIAAVENSISGDSFRPGDVLRSRKGDTVEIGNTDAEGRLILADALVFADESAPDLIVDFATLTGAARVALGPDLPAAFTGDDTLAQAFARYSASEADPSWRMPLWQPYRAMLDSKIADLNNVGTAPLAGAIVAALFLERFVERARTWLHLDLFAWNPSAKPGRPEGGEAQTIRALMALLTDRYGKEQQELAPSRAP
jgi:leucyl aminopeptidase